MTPTPLRLQRARALYAHAQATAHKLKQGQPTYARYLRLRLATGLALDRSEYTRNLLKLGSIAEGDKWLAESLTPKVGESWPTYNGTGTFREVDEKGRYWVDNSERAGLFACVSLSDLLGVVCRDSAGCLSVERQNREAAKKEAKAKRVAAKKAALPLERYLATLPPMRAGKVRKSLTGCKTLSRMLRHKWAEKYYATVRADGDRIYVGESESYWLRGDVTKAALDYVSWLKQDAGRGVTV